MNPSIYEQTKAAIAELCEKAKLREGNSCSCRLLR